MSPLLSQDDIIEMQWKTKTNMGGMQFFYDLPQLIFQSHHTEFLCVSVRRLSPLLNDFTQSNLPPWLSFQISKNTHRWGAEWVGGTVGLEWEARDITGKSVKSLQKSQYNKKYM